MSLKQWLDDNRQGKGWKVSRLYGKGSRLEAHTESGVHYFNPEYRVYDYTFNAMYSIEVTPESPTVAVVYRHTPRRVTRQVTRIEEFTTEGEVTIEDVVAWANPKHL